MIDSIPLLKYIAFMLMKLALRILPSSCNEWARAMLTEFHYLDRDHDALLWAGGCVIAAISMRLDTMIIGNLKISRWILIPELLLCFVPLTLFWLDTSFGIYGIFRHNMDFVQQNIVRFPEGTAFTVMILTTAVLGLLGPVGLISAFRLIVLKQPVHARIAGIGLIAGPFILGIVTVTCLLLMRPVIWLDELGLVMLLFSVMPSIGAAHMFYISTPERSKRVST